VPAHVSGIELSRQLYAEVVRPSLERGFPGLPHSAALLGRGSEVLGLDDEMSTDHDWRARLVLFVGEDGQSRPPEVVEEWLRKELPTRFRDHPVEHETHTVRAFFLERLALDVDADVEARDWLTLPEHRLRMFTAGAVYHDEVGLQAVRERLGYYPRDVWLYLLMAGWWRVHPEANVAGRAGQAGDEIGSALIGSRLVSDLMRLCFLMERQYAPYSKWFGTAFSRLACGPELTPTLGSALHSESWQERERALMAAYEEVIAMHNALQITPPVSTRIERLWDRPFKVVWADIPDLLRAEIGDPAVLSIVERWPVGPVDQLRDLLWPASDRRVLLRVFDEDGSKAEHSRP
jgi:hypothetical protein